jgi:hypothetical protein
MHTYRHLISVVNTNIVIDLARGMPIFIGMTGKFSYICVRDWRGYRPVAKAICSMSKKPGPEGNAQIKIKLTPVTYPYTS